MDSLWIIVALVAGLVSGAGIVWFVQRGKTDSSAMRETELRRQFEETTKLYQEANTQVAVAKEQLTQMAKVEAALVERDERVEKLTDEVQRLAAEAAKFEAEAQSRIEALDEARKRMDETFKATAATVLEGQRETFFDLAKSKLEDVAKLSEKDLKERQEAIDMLLKPVDEKLKTLDQHIGELEKNREGAYKELKAQVEVLRDTNQLLQRDTANLTRALKGSSQRGRWGEIQLRRIIEIAEMSPHCDFLEQSSNEGEDGRVRPDLIVRMPEKGSIVIDAKVPDNIWLEAEAETDADLRQTKMREFARQVRSAVTSLGLKSYRPDGESVEFVVMFMPGEHYLGDALRADPDLLEYSFDRRVVLATPTTLLALLRTVYMGWQNAKLADSAKQVAEEGRKLHRHIAVFSEHFENVKKSFRRAQEALEKSESTANRGIFSTARRLEKLAAKSEKSLTPQALAAIGDDDAPFDAPEEISFEEPTALIVPETSGLFTEEEPVS